MGGRKSKGFFTFLLATVFLISIAASAAEFSSVPESRDYERFSYLRLEEVAVKEAAYSSFSQAASEAEGKAKAANAAARAAGLVGAADERQAIRLALQARAASLQSELSESGFPVEFWCEAGGQRLPIQNPLCIGSFDADMLSRKLHFSGMGFTMLPDARGAGNFSATLPPCYEVGF
jgi:hypothetical protein